MSIRKNRICILGRRAAALIEPALDHVCSDSGHAHLSRRAVDEYVRAGAMHWVGRYHRVAQWTDGRSWKKTRCPGFGPVMQLVE